MLAACQRTDEMDPLVAGLDNRLYNLRFMPESLDGAKANTIEGWQVLLAREWRAQGLLTEEGLAAVERAGRECGDRSRP